MKINLGCLIHFLHRDTKFVLKFSSRVSGKSVWNLDSESRVLRGKEEEMVEDVIQDMNEV